MAQTAPRTGNTPCPPTAWLATPAVDLLIGCGGWTVPLAIVVMAAARAGVDTALAFYALALVCNYPHYAATIARAYGDPEVRAHRRFYTVYLTAVLAGLAALTPWSPWLAQVFVTVYLTWSPWHYSGQNFGIALLLARRRGIALPAHDRRWLRAVFVASYGLWLLWMHGTPPINPDVLSLGIPPAVALPARMALLLVFVVTLLVTARRLLAHGVGRVVAPLLVLGTQTLWFVVPTLPVPVGATAVGPAFFTGGVLAFAHCAQYLWITGYAARAKTRAWSAPAHALGLVVGGAALFLPIPWIASWLFPLELTRSLITGAALVNIHHFLIDGMIWKLRDARVAHALMGATEARPGPSTAPARRTPRWIPATVAAAVLGVAAIDLVQYCLTRAGASTAALARAGVLAPHDARALVREAEARAGAGSPADALALVERTLALDPANAAALRQRGLLLLQTGRHAEAAAHYDEVERRINPDLSTLVNGGVLAGRSGHLAQARTRLEQAVALEPQNPEAHLDLAEVAMLQHDPTAAIEHFRAYLACVDALPGPDAHTRALVVAVRRKLDAAETMVAAQRAR